MARITGTAAVQTGNVVIPDDEPVDQDKAPIVGTTDAEAAGNSFKLGDGPHGRATGIPKQKTVRIILEEQDNMPPTGQMFALNGKAYLIRPGEEVDVPEGILEVIDNAVTAKPIMDSSSLKVIGHRPQHRFPYRIVRPRGG